MHAKTWVVIAMVALVGIGCDAGGAEGDDAAAGAQVCALTGGTATGCADQPPELSSDTCRCGSRYYWDTSACVATAACRCLSGCERLFETEADCQAAYASCGRDAGP